MQAHSGLWTFALLPLSLAGSIAFAVSVAARSWLTAAALGSSLLFATLRLVGAAIAHRNREQVEATEAVVWRGEEIEVGVGLRFVVACLGGVALFALVALSLGAGWARTVVLTVAVIWALFVIVRTLRSPARILKIKREGVWDPKFGWVSWDDVERVSLLDMRVRSTRLSWLQLHLREPARARLLKDKRRPTRGMPVSEVTGDGAIVRYNLMAVAVHPERVRVVAEGWWAQARRMPQSPMLPRQLDVVAAQGSLDRTRVRMRRWTRAVIASYLLLPFALIGDILIGWTR